MTWLPDPRKLALPLIVLLAGILACTTLLAGQSVHDDSPLASTPANPDPAFALRANDALQRSRKLIDKFFEQMSNVVCNEDVGQSIVGKNGKPMYREESVFEYQMQANSRSGSLKLVESRDARKEAFRDPSKALLITNGFASMLLVLHQDFEPSFVFTPVSEEVVDGRTLVKIHFKPVPGASSPAAIQLRSRNYPLPLTGDLWLDSESGAVVKLTSRLDSGLDDLGHVGRDSCLIDPASAHHLHKNVRIEHAMHRDAFGGRFKACHLANHQLHLVVVAQFFHLRDRGRCRTELFATVQQDD